MKRLLILTLLVFSGVSSRAQSFEWAVSMGSEHTNVFYGTVRDSHGNLYVVGYSGDSATFGSNFFVKGGCFLSKLDSSGTTIFTKMMDSTAGFRIAINQYDEILVTGICSGSTFDGTPVSSPTGATSTGIAALYDTSGTLLWVEDYDAFEMTEVIDTRYGSFVLSGVVYNNGVVGGNVIGNGLHLNSFTAEIDRTGLFTMSERIAEDIYRSFVVATDTAGNQYMHGSYDNSTLLSNGTVLQSPGGSSGGYLVKCDPSGTILWAKNIFTGMFSGAYEMLDHLEITSNQNLVVCGAFSSDTLIIGTDTIIGPSNASFLISFDPSGSMNWFKILQAQHANSIAALPSGGFVLSAAYYSLPPVVVNIAGLPIPYNPTLPGANDHPLILVRFDDNGNPLWGKTIASQAVGGFCCEAIWSICPGSGNDLYISGHYSYYLGLDNLLLSCQGCYPYPIFLAKYNEDPLGINAIETDEVTMYPNPATDHLVIGAGPLDKGEKSIEIFNTSGQRVALHRGMTLPCELPVFDLPNGMYSLRITDAASVRHAVFVVAK